MRLQKVRGASGFILNALLLAGSIQQGILAQGLTKFDVPGAGITVPASINESGQITGYYSYPGDNTRHGFLRHNDGAISLFEGVPAAINDAGVITGAATFPNVFVREQQGSTTLFDPATNFLHSFPKALAINNRGEIAGYIVLHDGDIYDGFIRDQQGNVSTFAVKFGMVPVTINARGDIAGYNSVGLVGAGILQDRNGGTTVFRVPYDSFNCTFPISVNNNGDVAGYFLDASDCPSSLGHNDNYRGFVRSGGGTLTIFDAAPNALRTYSTAINESGDVVGYFFDRMGGNHDFLRDSIGNVTVFDAGYPTSLNNRGDVVGYFSDGTGTHGFVRASH